MQIMNRYPAIGSPCLQPLPTLILGVGKPFIRMEDWKLASLNHKPTVSRNENTTPMNTPKKHGNDLEKEEFEEAVDRGMPTKGSEADKEKTKEATMERLLSPRTRIGKR